MTKTDRAILVDDVIAKCDAAIAALQSRLATPPTEPAASKSVMKRLAVQQEPAAAPAGQPEHHALLCEQFASDFTTSPPKNEFEHGVQTACARLAEAIRRGAHPSSEPAAAPQPTLSMSMFASSADYQAAKAAAPQSGPSEALGKFGHHPDPAIDFCVEVEAIEGEVVDHAAGLVATMDLPARIERALAFRVGGDRCAVEAKAALRRLAASQATEQPRASITITLRQAEDLVGFFGGHDAEVAVQDGFEGQPPGLYAWCVECPDEGSVYLGPTEVDDELAERRAQRHTTEQPADRAQRDELLEIVRTLSLATYEGDDAAVGTHYIAKDGKIRCKGSFLDLIERARAALARKGD